MSEKDGGCATAAVDGVVLGLGLVGFLLAATLSCENKALHGRVERLEALHGIEAPLPYPGEGERPCEPYCPEEKR